ncbi:hypothetical protein C6P45_003453 [Maudiozyma exigua]|uniref:Uncharacterized protein n=1 Tax=Maudiozyma exigua TaxID=34358 RepID=A0A9P7B283_MAUEX|nr:hypothetical protein C6P45_003453 [Kazachstania exigua]
MNNSQYSASNNPVDVYRPSASERLQAERKNEKLRNIQEKRRSQNFTRSISDEENRNKIKSHSNRNNDKKYNFHRIINPNSDIKNDENNDNNSDDDINISKINSVSPFYAKPKNDQIPQNYNDDEEDQYDPSSYPPKVMSPASLLESRGFSSSLYVQDSAETDYEPKMEGWGTIGHVEKETLRSKRQVSGVRTLRKNLGDPLPLPYLRSHEPKEEPKHNNLRVLTKGELENKSEYFNNKFKQLLSQDKINIAKRLKQLNRTTKQEDSMPVYRNPFGNEHNQYFQNKIRHSDSNVKSSHKLSRKSSLEPTNNEQVDNIESNAASTSLKAKLLVDELVLLELQRTLDSNGEKLDIMISLLKDYYPGSSMKRSATHGLFQGPALIRTVYFLMVLLVLLYMFYVSYGVYKIPPYM